MVEKNKKMTVSRRDFLKGVGALSVLAAAGGSIPLSIFEASCSSGQPTGSQTFTTNLGGEPDTIDPNLASWAGDLSIIYRCFEGLLGFNKDLTLKAVCATQIPTTANGGISADGKTYTFKLKSNVTWSDGTKVKAGDFAYSIVRMLDPALAAEYASFYYTIAGAQAYNSATNANAATLATLKAAVGVSAPDDSTLVVKLAAPQATFLQLMALWPAYPLRQDVIAKYGDKWTEAGNYMSNGPMVLSEWVHQDHLTFTPNPNYWGTKPKLTKITFKMIADANAAWSAYLNNELDQCGPPGGTEKTVIADPVLSKQIVRFNELTTFAFQFQVHTPPYDNKTLRQALATGIDRQAYINQVRNGIGKVALSWIPPGMPGYNANLGTDYAFNVTKAKQLLATALTQLNLSDASKLKLRFQYNNAGLNPQLAQFLQAQMSTNLGINLTLEPMEAKAFSAMVNANQET
ncbi:MAG: ABC transporter substrate-binding protein, partial [Dehalococcoidales bacterium]